MKLEFPNGCGEGNLEDKFKDEPGSNERGSLSGEEPLSDNFKERTGGLKDVFMGTKGREGRQVTCETFGEERTGEEE